MAETRIRKGPLAVVLMLFLLFPAVALWLVWGRGLILGALTVLLALVIAGSSVVAFAWCLERFRRGLGEVRFPQKELCRLQEST